MTSASAVNSWPIEASARKGIAATKAGRLSRLRSCPALTTRPCSRARAAVIAQACNSLLAAPQRHGDAGVGVEEQPSPACQPLQFRERQLDDRRVLLVKLPALFRGAAA